MRIIKAKFQSTCGCGCLNTVKRGVNVSYDQNAKKVYLLGHEPEDKNNTGDMVNAQENAYFDNFCQSNNI